MENIEKLLKWRELLYTQIHTANARIANYYGYIENTKIGDLYYDDYFYYLVIEKTEERALVVQYQKTSNDIFIHTVNMDYTDLVNFNKVESDNGILKSITDYLLNIKN